MHLEASLATPLTRSVLHSYMSLRPHFLATARSPHVAHCSAKLLPVASLFIYLAITLTAHTMTTHSLQIVQAKGDATKDKAAAEKDASHTIGKIGPYAVSSSGGISSDDPRRTQGSYDQTVGSAKEALGGLVGAEGLKKEGQQQSAMGKGTEAEGQLADYGHGLKDRVGGTVGGIAAGITGDREKQ